YGKSIRRRSTTIPRPTTARSEALAVVVVDGGLGAEHLGGAGVGPLARVDPDLARIRVLAGVDLRQGRECQVAHRRLAGVDDLVGDLRPARREAITSCWRIGSRWLPKLSSPSP